MIYKDEIAWISKEQFIKDLVNECVTDVKKCIASGAAEVGMDMTEATYAMKVDKTGKVLKDMVGLVDLVCDQLSPEELNKVTLAHLFWCR